MKKTLFTLCVDNYEPEITEITFPLFKMYADKIGAEFFVIKERRYPDFPPVYEKLQIYDLGREMQNDWNIFLDADTMLRPDIPDVTSMVPKDTVLFHGKDFASSRWRYDKYFLRDGRHIGACSWFVVASDWCLDLWHPLDMKLEEAVKNIFPIPAEVKHSVKRDHLIDDYTLSRNIAKYGLKHAIIQEYLAHNGLRSIDFLWHDYLIDADEKIVKLGQIKKAWGF